MDRQNVGLVLVSLIGFLGCTVFSIGLYTSNTAYGLEDIVLKDPGSFIDNNGRIGVIDNNGNFPVNATVAVNVTERIDGNIG